MFFSVCGLNERTECGSLPLTCSKTLPEIHNPPSSDRLSRRAAVDGAFGMCQEPNRLHDLRKVARRPKWASRSRMEPLIYQNLAIPGSSPRRMRPATM